MTRPINRYQLGMHPPNYAAMIAKEAIDLQHSVGANDPSSALARLSQLRYYMALLEDQIKESIKE